jgi:hypothetical protein
MQLDAQPAAGGQLAVRVPPTRSDVLHACDVMEDVAIAHGFNNIPLHVGGRCVCMLFAGVCSSVWACVRVRVLRIEGGWEHAASRFGEEGCLSPRLASNQLNLPLPTQPPRPPNPRPSPLRPPRSRQVPSTYTPGRELPLNQLTELLRGEVAMAGYTEVLTWWAARGLYEII